MIEVMESEDPAARRRKEETHHAMTQLGTLCIMEADWFDTPRGLAAAGTNVTDKVRSVLRRRLARGVPPEQL